MTALAVLLLHSTAEAEFVDVIAHLDARASALGTETRRRELEQTPFHDDEPGPEAGVSEPAFGSPEVRDH